MSAAITGVGDLSRARSPKRRKVRRAIVGRKKTLDVLLASAVVVECPGFGRYGAGQVGV